MKTYGFDISIGVQMEAPSLEDATVALEDVFGNGELQDFGIKVLKFQIEES